jgi:hypothetical protein
LVNKPVKSPCKSGCVCGYRKVYEDLRTSGLQAQRDYKRKNNYGDRDLSQQKGR